MSFSQGYFSGGQYLLGGVTYTVSTLTDKITYSNSTTFAQTSANLTETTVGQQGMSDVTDGRGYIAVIGSNEINKIAYANDTCSLVSATLSTPAPYASCISDNTDGKGYIAGGDLDVIPNTTYKFIYSSETNSAQTTANLSQARFWHIGISANSFGKGYFFGGTSTNSPFNDVATADKITYSNDTTVAQTSANLTVPRDSSAAVADNVDGKGYIAGGESNQASTDVALVDKIVFSTDTTAAQTSANLTQARDALAGVSDNPDGKGYFCGGYLNIGNTNVTTGEKLTYASNTTVAQTSANLSLGRGLLSGVSGNDSADNTIYTCLFQYGWGYG